MRKLASIQRITDIQPIDGADAIEVASILGWKVVIAKRDGFKIGDLVVYCELDSVLPPKPEFEFLAKYKYRVKTVRLRGQVSQGLCFPLSVLDGLKYQNDTRENPMYEWKEDQEVTEVLGVTKYDPPEISSGGGFLQGKTAGNFPCYVPKTDEVRLQASPKLLKELVGIPLYVTEKVDGTSATFSIFDGEVNVCSRNRSVKEDGNNVYWKMAHKYNIIEILNNNLGIAIQGEIAGPGIQGNKLGLTDIDLFIFNVYDIKTGNYFTADQFFEFCKVNNLVTVPQMEDIILTDEPTIEEFLDLAKGKYASGNPREGIVVRARDNEYSPSLKGRLSFKVINNDFLLKEK
jgi:RNA ligase (TIGR02306 family)